MIPSLGAEIQAWEVIAGLCTGPSRCLASAALLGHFAYTLLVLPSQRPALYSKALSYFRISQVSLPNSPHWLQLAASQTSHIAF